MTFARLASHQPTFRLSLCSALMLSIVSLASADEKLKHWKQFPEPKGTPKIPRPADSEFLKLLPRLRKAPAFDEKAQQQGFALLILT